MSLTSRVGEGRGLVNKSYIDLADDIALSLVMGMVKA